MFASLALVPAAIGVLAPAGPDDGCPSPRQVTESLGAHLPGVVLPLGQPIGPSALRLGMSANPAGMIHLDLVDQDGVALLHRTLSASERAPGTDCPALAETVALIIDRYWHEVGYAVPPLQLAAASPGARNLDRRVTGARSPPEWSLGIAVAGRAGSTGDLDRAALLAVDVQGHGGGLRLSAGVMNGASPMTSLGTATFRRFPFRLGGYRSLPLGVGQLEPGLGLDLEAISVNLTDVTTDTYLMSPNLCAGAVCLSPGADVALGWSVASTHHVYFRALAQAGAGFAYRFVVAGTPVWSTPRTYVQLALEWGTWFP